MIKYYLIRHQYGYVDIIELDKYNSEIHNIIEKCSDMSIASVLKGERIFISDNNNRHLSTPILSADDFIGEVKRHYSWGMLKIKIEDIELLERLIK